MNITRPSETEYPPYYHSYIQAVEGDDLFEALQKAEDDFALLIRSVQPAKGGYRYAEGKWSIKEVLVHIIDAERVFAYRALTFARGDKTPLPSFDEEKWVPESGADSRSLENILNEHFNVRQATFSLFENLSPEATVRKGIANGHKISVRALGYIIAGHALHHLQTLRERYMQQGGMQPNS